MNESTKIYILECQNYHGEYFTEYYLSPENALCRLTKLRNEGKRQDEYECDGLYSFSFFDANYNADSTYISLSDGTVKDLFQDWEN